MNDSKDELPQQELEKIKLLAEHSKHITTVATAAIVATLAFITKLVALHGKFLVILSAGSFFIAMCSALFVHGYVLERFVGAERRDRNIQGAFILSHVGICLGVLFLLVCIFVNIALA